MFSKVKGIFAKDAAPPAPPPGVAAAGIVARSGTQPHIWPLDPATKAALASGAARYNCKVVIRGARGTGKSTLLSLLTGTAAPQGPSQALSAATVFVPFAAPSLGTSEAPTVLPVASGLHEAGLPPGAGAKVELWDVVDEAAAQGGADSRAIDVYRGCNAVIFMVDVRNRASFDYVEEECRRVPPSCCTLVCLNFMDAISAVAATAVASNDSFALPPSFVTEEEVDRLCQSMPRVSTPERTQLCRDLTAALAEVTDGPAAGVVDAVVLRAGDTAAVASWLPVALAPRTGAAFGLSGVKSFLLAPMHLQNVAALELQMRQSFEAMELVRAHLLLLRAQMHEAQRSAAADARRNRTAPATAAAVGPAPASEAPRAVKAAPESASSPTGSSPSRAATNPHASPAAPPPTPAAVTAAAPIASPAASHAAKASTQGVVRPVETPLKFEAPKRPVPKPATAELGGTIDNFFDDVESGEEETPEAKARRQKEFFGGDSSSEDEPPLPAATGRAGLRVLGGRGRASGLNTSTPSAAASASASPTSTAKGPAPFSSVQRESSTEAAAKPGAAAPAVVPPQQPPPAPDPSASDVVSKLPITTAVPTGQSDARLAAVAAAAAEEEQRLQAALNDMLSGTGTGAVDDFFGADSDDEEKSATAAVAADPAPAIAAVAAPAFSDRVAAPAPADKHTTAMTAAPTAAPTRALGRLGGRRKQQATSEDDETPAPAAPVAKARPVVGSSAPGVPSGGAAALGVDVAALLAQMQSSLAAAPVPAGEGEEDAGAYGGVGGDVPKEKRSKRDKSDKAEKKEKRAKKEKSSRAAEDSDG